MNSNDQFIAVIFIVGLGVLLAFAILHSVLPASKTVKALGAAENCDELTGWSSETRIQACMFLQFKRIADQLEANCKRP